VSKIFTLSEAASIAIHSMVLVARAKDGINVVQIAEYTGLSKNHIAKVMQRLAKSDLVKSVRGPAGGFSLKRDPKTVSLLDIYEMIEGPLEESDCPLNYSVCNYEKCIIGNIVNEMTSGFKTYLKNQTLDKYR
jgi:Rrf2 family protein